MKWIVAITANYPNSKTRIVTQSANYPNSKTRIVIKRLTIQTVIRGYDNYPGTSELYSWSRHNTISKSI